MLVYPFAGDGVFFEFDGEAPTIVGEDVLTPIRINEGLLGKGAEATSQNCNRTPLFVRHRGSVGMVHLLHAPVKQPSNLEGQSVVVVWGRRGVGYATWRTVAPPSNLGIMTREGGQGADNTRSALWIMTLPRCQGFEFWVPDIGLLLYS